MSVLDNPVLQRDIQVSAARATRTMHQSDRAEAQKDVAQTLCVLALEMEARFRGDNNAAFPTYVHQAATFQAYRTAADLECPVKTAKHKKGEAWKVRVKNPRPPVNTKENIDGQRGTGSSIDHMDFAVVEGLTDRDEEEHTVERLLEERAVRAIAAVIEAQPEPTLVVHTVLAGETLVSAAQRTGTSVFKVKGHLRRFKEALAGDPELQALRRERFSLRKAVERVAASYTAPLRAG